MPSPLVQNIEKVLANCPTVPRYGPQGLLVQPCTSCQFGPSTRQSILAEIAVAPFNPDAYPAGDEPESRIVGRKHPITGDRIEENTWVTSLEAHTIKRIANRHWDPALQPLCYLRDLQATVQANDLRVYVGYEQRTTNRWRLLAACTVPVGNLRTLVPMLRGAPSESLFLLYDPKGQFIVTGYPVPSFPMMKRFERWSKVHLIR